MRIATTDTKMSAEDEVLGSAQLSLLAEVADALQYGVLGFFVTYAAPVGVPLFSDSANRIS